MGLQTLISGAYVVIQFAQCNPISANWNTGIASKCWNLRPIITLGWIIAGVYIAMDLMLSLMPIRLIRTLNRSTSEKILIGVLMALGLLATTINCAKMTTFSSFGKGDVMQATILPSMWAKLEEEVGIIATSLPWLKSPVENWLKKMDLLKEHQLTRPSVVADLSLPADRDDSSDRDIESAGVIKANFRFDSAAVLGTKGSSTSLINTQRNNFGDVV
ncbi:hypothetical protein Ptr902_07099 [Pyrenophora tritici-repentis]|nr:hypothetical protein TUN205_08013 [Pyrenophora tritici-repentis]KAI0619840.1 hypothetical protein TUN199_08163 [Pyrenophora tritici-repentis]KAI1565767.1 hypothetical protein PtrEW7m1_009781 [Pyrenophora tritici-repentis]KAI2481304.1 hypothetical protein Ptr902_07099 [Pyrenophora tritici-repentis]PZD23008.1 hypothetical protein A1F96_10635 [Pyrenophora tritici-repentis]